MAAYVVQITQANGPDTVTLDATSTPNVLNVTDGSTFASLTVNANTASPLIVDPDPTLSADLDLNGNDITGTGNITTTGDVTLTGDMVLSGDLTVNGTTTTLNTQTLDVEDKNITVAFGAVDAASANGAGLTVDGANATLTYQSAGDNWALNKDLAVSGDIDLNGTKILLPNKEKAGLTNDGDLGFDSSQGLILYRTQQGVSGDAVTVLDGANVAAGTGVSITNLGAGGTGTQTFTFSIGQAVGTGDSPTFAGLSTTGDMTFGDNDKAIFGAGSDLEIYHDGSNSFIVDNGVGNLVIRADSTVFLQSTSGETYFRGDNNGSVKLYYNNGQKLTTTTGGIEVTGTVEASAAVEVGEGSGSVALTINDGYGNANVTFNHRSGVPDQNGNAARIEVNTDATSGAAMQFELESNVTGGTPVTLTNVMTMTETGLGIGTNSPSAKLHVNNGYILNEATVPFYDLYTTSGTATDFARTRFLQDDDLFALTTRDSTGTFAGNNLLADIDGSGFTNWRFYTNNSERVRIDDTGLGIGTISPSAALHVVGTGGTTLRLEATNTATSSGIDFYGKDAGGTTYQAGNINSAGGSGSLEFSADPTGAETNTRITFLTDGSEAMRIDSSGNVGIGTSSPSVPLDVTGNAAVSGKAKIGTGADGSANGDELVVSKDQTNVGMSILAADATGFARLFLGSQTDTQAASIRHNENNDRLFVQAKGDIHFQTGGTNTTATLNSSGDLDVTGALSKGSGSFKIDHPLKPETHHLVHSFIEGPQADNLYRGTVALVCGAATVNLDTAGRMTEGTFVALNGNVQCFTSNEQGWTAVRGSVSGNILTIEAQDATCTDVVSWMVIGERHDQHMIDTAWTDAAGRVITEPEKPPVEEDDTE